MKILVTGGAGYIGSHMTRMLIRRGFEAVVLDTLEYGHREAVPEQAPLVVGNVSDTEVLRSIFSTHHIDGVMHFAGYLQVEESVRFPIKYMRNNVIGPVSLLECMKEADVRNILFSSTAAVYGNPQTVPIPETHPKQPVSPYGLSKWAFEELLRVYDRSFGLKSISLRYFNAAGASLDGNHGEHHNPETHIIPLACLTALGKRPEFSLFGTDYETPDGSALRDFIHIEDLCDAHIKAMEALLNGHKTDQFNIGTSVGTSVKMLVDEVRRAVGHDFPVKEAGRRPGDPPTLVADASKISKEFGWKPTHSDIKTVVASALAWHTSHPTGYDNRH
jgi:UDP-glucose 4-epimerase